MSQNDASSVSRLALSDILTVCERTPSLSESSVRPRSTVAGIPDFHLPPNFRPVEGNSSNPNLQIKCGDRTFLVHRVVVCAKSEFFRAACLGHFKEGETGVVELHDKPELVERMFSFFYTSDYRGGANVASSQLIHTHMYAMADKYLVHDLKALALKKFQSEEFESWKFATGLILGNIYTSTPESDRGLRKAVVEACAGNVVFVGNDKLCQEILALVPGPLSDIMTVFKTKIATTMRRKGIYYNLLGHHREDHAGIWRAPGTSADVAGFSHESYETRPTEILHLSPPCAAFSWAPAWSQYYDNEDLQAGIPRSYKRGLSRRWKVRSQMPHYKSMFK